MDIGDYILGRQIYSREYKIYEIIGIEEGMFGRPKYQLEVVFFYDTQDKQKKQRERVIAQLKIDGRDGSCIADLSYVLGLDKSTMSARFNELKKAGKIEMVNKRPSKTTGITSEHWRLTKFNETLFYLD